MKWEDPEDSTYRLHPLVQSLGERAYFFLLRYLNRREAYKDTVRFAPPLIIRRDQIDWALETIKRALTAA